MIETYPEIFRAEFCSDFESSAIAGVANASRPQRAMAFWQVEGKLVFIMSKRSRVGFNILICNG